LLHYFSIKHQNIFRKKYVFLIIAAVFLILALAIIFSEFNQVKSNNKISLQELSYSKRYIDSTNCIREQYGLLKKSLNNHISNDELLSYSFLTLSYIKFKNADSIHKYYQKAALLANNMQQSSSIGYFLYAKYRFNRYFDIPKAENELLEAIGIFQKDSNYFWTSKCAVSLAYSSDKINKKWCDLGLEFAKKSKHPDAILSALNCQSTYLKEQYESTLVSKQQVTNAYENAINFAEQNTINEKFELAIVYLNYANWMSNFSNSFQVIENPLNKAIEIAKEYNIMSVLLCSFGIKSQIYININKLKEAEKILLEGLNYSLNIPFKDYRILKNYYSDLKKVVLLQNNLEKFVEYDKDYIQASEKYAITAESETTKNISIKYDIKSLDDKIINLKSQNRLKSFLFGLTLVFLIVISVLFYYYHRSIKIEQALEVQKLVDMQKNLMNNILHLEKKNKILNEIKDQLLSSEKENSKSENNKIIKIINNGLLVDEDFEKFSNNFSTIYPLFFNKLQKIANNTLTKLDLRYCGFILMNVSNKEIANQMNVEPKSIRMARYRIKQKLQLGKDESLDGFIQELSE
jgi:hypothetical protein